MSPDQQLAEAQKYSSALVWSIAELRPDLWAVYDYARQLRCLGTLEACITYYRNRPAYKPPQHLTTSSKAANTAALLSLLKGTSS